MAAISRMAASALLFSVMSRKITVNSFLSPTFMCEIEASIGNSLPSARNPLNVPSAPMRRLVTPWAPKLLMCSRCASRKRVGRN